MKEISSSNEAKNHGKDLKPTHEIPTEESRRKFKDVPSRNKNERYKMNNGATLDRMRNHLPEERRTKFDEGIASGSNPKVRLIPKGEKFYRTGGTGGGNYFTKEHPGLTSDIRKENLQLRPDNDGKKLSKVRSTRPQLGIESDINPQPKWAKEAGYNARPGMKQVFVPSANEKGALADNRFKFKEKGKH